MSQPKSVHRRRLGAIGIALAMLAGCAGSGSESGAGGDAGAGSDDEAAGGTLAVAAQTTPVSADPNVYSTPAHVAYSPNWVSTLVTWTKPDGPDDLPGPDDVEGELAESWEIEDDGIVFTLREMTSAAGNPLTAEDVVYSYERAAALEDFVAPILLTNGAYRLESPAEAIDDRTVKLYGDPQSLSLAVLASAFPGVLDQELVEENATEDDPWATEWLTTNSASFAPYTVSAIDPGSQLTLEANPNYWRGAPAYERVVLRAVPESATRLQLLRSQEVDWAQSLTSTDQSQAEADGDLSTVTTAASVLSTLSFNAASGPLADPLVRRAIGLALDRTALLAGPFQEYGSLPTSYFASDAGTDFPGLVAPSAQIEEAESLLTEAGFPDGLDLTLSYFGSELEATGADTAAVAVLVQSQLAEAGIDLQLDQVGSDSQFYAAQAAGEYEITFNLQADQVADPLYGAQLWYLSANTTTSLEDPEVDQLIEQGLAQDVGSTERSDTLVALDQRLHETGNGAPLVQAVRYGAFRQGVEGFLPFPGVITNFAWVE